LDAAHELVAGALSEAAIATLLIDLLTRDERAKNTVAGDRCNDIQLLASRLVSATDWLDTGPQTSRLRVGYFCTGVGSAVALTAAAERPASVSAIVACKGRPLLVRAALPQVRAPTLLIALASDSALARVNRAGLVQLMCEKCLDIVPAVLTDEAELEKEVARRARAWFERYLVLPSED
jgi:dienelactone hydrolase